MIFSQNEKRNAVILFVVGVVCTILLLEPWHWCHAFILNDAELDLVLDEQPLPDGVIMDESPGDKQIRLEPEYTIEISNLGFSTQVEEISPSGIGDLMDVRVYWIPLPDLKFHFHSITITRTRE